MNWSDYAVIGIIIVFAIIGLVRGFVFSVFKIASFFAAIFVSIKLYPRASEYLGNTVIADNIKSTILDNLIKRYEAIMPSAGQMGADTIDSVVEELAIPAFFKQGIAGRLPGPGEFIDVQGILDSISSELTGVIINVISLLLVFVLVRLGLLVIGLVLRGLVKLPVLKQFDRLGGVAFGLLEGLTVVYLLLALLFLFSTSPQFQPIFSDLEASLLAKAFYDNNVLISWIFPKTVS